MTSHVALITSAGTGHSLPIATAASLLVKSSERVRVTLFYPADPETPPPLLPVHDRLRSQAFPISLGQGLEAMKAVWEMKKEMLEACEAVIAESDWGLPSIYLFDMFATWVLDLAAKFGRPHALLWTAPILFLYTLLNEEDTDIPDVGRVRKVDLTDHGDAEKILRLHFDRLRQCRVVVANDNELLYRPSAPGDVPMLQRVLEAQLSDNGVACRLYLTGMWAVKDVRLATHPDSTLMWLDAQKENSVILIALGSWCPVPAHDVVELARGLQLLDVPFLWAYRDKTPVPPFIPHAPVGYKPPSPQEPTEEDGLPIDFRSAVADRSLIVPWVNQPAVLRHPSIRAFVTHCGWNSLSEALALSGKPLIGLPLMADQNLNAILIEKLGVGKRLWLPDHPRLLSRDAVSTTVSTVLESAEMLRKAQELRQALSGAWRDDGCASQEMQNFLHREAL